MAVAFDSVGPSSAGSGGASPRSYTHTTVAGSTKVLVGASIDGVAVGATVTCTLGGTAMTSLGQVAAAGGTTGIVQAWTMDGVSAGAHTIVVTCAAAADVECGSIAFSAAGALSAAVTNSGASITASAAVNAAPTSIIAAFTAAGNTIASSSQTSRFINNFAGGSGQSTGNAAGATAAGTGSPVTMAWTLTGATDTWAVIAVEVQALAAPAPPVPLPQLPPGWFPGADAVAAVPGGIPFAPLPGTTDAAPAVIFPATPEAAPVLLPLHPPGWFPGSAAVTQDPGGIPFYSEPPPADPSLAVLPPPAPDILGIADWLPLPPGYFPGSQSVTIDPGGIPFYPFPQPLLPPPAPAPLPVITGQSGGPLGWFSDQFGTPRLHWGTYDWGLPANAGRWNGGSWRGDYDAYFAARGAQGLTLLYCHPWGHTHTGCNNDLGHTWDGVFPFLVNGSAADLTAQAGTITLNEPFWTRIDYLFSAAAGVGMSVFFNLSGAFDMPTGLSHGFTNGVFANAATAQIQAASQLIAARYKNTPNLVWQFGDDYYDDDDTDFNAMQAGIAAADPRINSCMSVENYPTGNTARYDLSVAPGSQTAHAFGATYAKFNFCYEYQQTYFAIEYAYTEPSPLGPVVWGDGFFLGRESTDALSAKTMRFMVWWALASGARGCTMGDETSTQWSSGAYTEITTADWYIHSAAKVRAFYEGLTGWNKLIPDTSSQLVTSGRGTRAVYTTAEWLQASGTDTYVCASRTPDGSLAVIYGSQGMSITVNQALLGPGYTATWVDPANTATQAAATGSTYNSAGLGNNSKGDPDWVLVLQGPALAQLPPGLPVGQPQPPGWFPGADKVTAVPGAVPFAQPPADPSFAVAGAATIQGSAALSGTGTLTAAPVQTIQAAASLSGLGTLTASPQLAGTASLSGLGTLTAAPVLAGTAALSGVGTLTATPQIQGTANLTGLGTLTATPQLAATAALFGSGTLTALWTFGDTLALSGSGTLSVSQSAGSASLSGLGSLTATPILQGSASLSGLGTLTAAWTLRQVATLTGAGTLTAAGGVIFPAAAALSGRGTLTAAVVPPFTVGTLTASDRAAGVLTGVTASGGSGGVLTASDTRTGGPS